MEPPLKTWYNWRTRKWRLLDNRDIMLADNLTEETAKTLTQALNLLSRALVSLKQLIDTENTMEQRKDAQDYKIRVREEALERGTNLLVELGIIEPPPKYIDGFPEWRNNLLETFFEKTNFFHYTEKPNKKKDK